MTVTGSVNASPLLALIAILALAVPAAGSAMLPDDAFGAAKVDEWLFWEQYSHEPYIAVCRFQMHYLGKSAAEREAWRVERGEAALDLMDLEPGVWRPPYDDGGPVWTDEWSNPLSALVFWGR